jgi:hypothetical protein
MVTPRLNQLAAAPNAMRLVTLILEKAEMLKN